MNCTYKLREDIILNEDGIKVLVFGIEAVATNGSIIMSVPDVFVDRNKAKALVNDCNKLGLSQIHLMDVIEDALV